MSSRVLFDDIFHIIRLEGFFELSSRHKEFDLMIRTMSQKTITNSRHKVCHSLIDKKC